jgi:hypothetical protein
MSFDGLFTTYSIVFMEVQFFTVSYLNFNVQKVAVYIPIAGQQLYPIQANCLGSVGLFLKLIISKYMYIFGEILRFFLVF